MAVVNQYKLKSTKLIPNSSYPLIRYRNAFLGQPGAIYARFKENGWDVKWIYRYGSTQESHYHSRSHECMAVLSGTATIRFGAADLSKNLDDSTWGDAWESGDHVEVDAVPGDIFIIPAGVAHKTYNTKPAASFSLLTPGDGQKIDCDDPQKAIANVDLSGFTMMGAYPFGDDWDFATGDADHSDWERVWAVPKPSLDPVMGESLSGICGTWQST